MLVGLPLRFLRVMGYERDETIVHARKNIRLHMCGEFVHAKTDVCIMDVSSEILLLVQEDKTHMNPSDPEAQLMAEAIGAFQENNAKRVNELFLEPLEMQLIPGITMVGTFPRLKLQPIWIVASDSASIDRKSTRLNSSHLRRSRMPSSA